MNTQNVYINNTDNHSNNNNSGRLGFGEEHDTCRSAKHEVIARSAWPRTPSARALSINCFCFATITLHEKITVNLPLGGICVGTSTAVNRLSNLLPALLWYALEVADRMYRIHGASTRIVQS